MPRKRRIPPAVGVAPASVIAELRDPGLIRMFHAAIVDYIPDTSAQDSQAKSYLMFCKAYKIDPWPATETIRAAWIIILASRISVKSIPGYLSGVRYHQRILGVAASAAWHI